jgi:8-oxo-dGTP pyrophosphatase MutT (NUDIX family)
MGPAMMVSVEVLVGRDGSYLLVVRSQDEDFGAGWLTLPGGKLEPDETGLRVLQSTAQRELKEEVDLDVDLDDLRYVESHIFFIDDVPVLDVVMVTWAARGEARAMDPAEVESVMWMTRAEIEANAEIPEWTRASIAMPIT